MWNSLFEFTIFDSKIKKQLLLHPLLICKFYLNNKFLNVCFLRTKEGDCWWYVENDMAAQYQQNCDGHQLGWKWKGTFLSVDIVILPKMTSQYINTSSDFWLFLFYLFNNISYVIFSVDFLHSKKINLFTPFCFFSVEVWTILARVRRHIWKNQCQNSKWRNVCRFQN